MCPFSWCCALVNDAGKVSGYCSCQNPDHCSATPVCCWVAGQPADFERQLGYGNGFNTHDASLSPFGSPYTPPHDFDSPYTSPHDPFQVPSPSQAPAGFATPYNLNEEEGARSGHQALYEHGVTNQHSPQPTAPETAVIAKYGGTSNSAPPFSPAYPPSLSVGALEDSQMSQYDQYHPTGGSINNSAGSAGQKRKSAGLYQNGPCRSSPAPQPAYAPSSPRAYAPSSPRAYSPYRPRAHAPSSPRPYAPSSPRAYAPSNPHALPAELTKFGNGQSAGNLAAGPGSQGSPGAALGAVPTAQASSAVSTSQSVVYPMQSVTWEANVLMLHIPQQHKTAGF